MTTRDDDNHYSLAQYLTRNENVIDKYGQWSPGDNVWLPLVRTHLILTEVEDFLIYRIYRTLTPYIQESVDSMNNHHVHGPLQ